MTGKKVAIVQSSYLPWKGYFDIAHDVDEFIFLDEVQYTVRDWRNRNRIKTADGAQWLSVPVGDDRKRVIHEVKPVDASWQEKHWKSIRHAYGRAAFFPLYREFFEEIYLGTRWESLSDFNQVTTRRIAHELLGLTTRFVDSRQYAGCGSKLDLILSLLEQSGATSYLSGPSALDYLEPERFAERSLELLIKRYEYPSYPQPHPPFMHEVSVIDLLFHTGPAAPTFIWKSQP
jgi:hypothetical protein